MGKRSFGLLPILAALALTLILELLLFNWKSVFSLGGTWTPLPEPKRSGDLAQDQELAFFFYDQDREIGWCHIDFEVRNAEGELVPTHYTVNYNDEGNDTFYRAGEFRYFPGCDNASWFHLNSYGKIHHMSVVLKTDEAGCTWKLKAAEINGAVPLRISVWRMIALFFLFLLLWLFRPGSSLYDNRLWNKRRWVKALCVLLILVMNIGALCVLANSNQVLVKLRDDMPGTAQHQQYAKLARALERGETWIDSDTDRPSLDLLDAMKNPYNSSARRGVFQNTDVLYSWDTAYYKGHYYVYFGVVPVLLFYLPYHLFTGADLSTVWVAILCGALIVVGAFVFLRALIRRYFPKTPFPVYLLLSVLFGNCTGLLSSAVIPSFYIVPVHLALAFTLFALSLWLSAARRWTEGVGAAPLPSADACFAPDRVRGGAASIDLRIAAGAFLAALVAGCRPQFLVCSALAAPILLPPARREARRGVTLRRVLLFALPYLAVALPLMYYNYIRFGSPFDFGANYNLTTNDMPHRGWKPDRLADGYFAYLFCLPRLTLRFPFFQNTDFKPIYLGKTILEPVYGGVLPLAPFLWNLLGLRRVWAGLREKRLLWLALLPLLLSLIVIAADTEMAGLVSRYTEDFLLLLYLSAALVFLTGMERSDPASQRRRRAYLLAAVCVTMLVCFLISLNDNNIYTGSPERFYQARDFFCG